MRSRSHPRADQAAPPCRNPRFGMSPLNCGAVVRISFWTILTNGHMIENAPQRIAPDNRDSREPQCHFSRFSQSDLDAEKREDHSLRANGDEVAYGHIDTRFEKAVAASLAGHRTITFPNIEFFFLILLMAIST